MTLSGESSSSAPKARAAALSAGAAESHIGFTPVAQGAYFVVTGIWPILHRRSFEAVTGPKVDRWLVKTFGALVASIGGTLIVGGVEVPRSRTLSVLGIGSAVALGLAELVYVRKGRIARVYLLDALLEGAIAVAWVLERRAHRNTHREVEAGAAS